MARFWQPIASLVLGMVVSLFGDAAVLAAPLTDADFQVMVDRFCVACHNSVDREGHLDLASVAKKPTAANRATWERVVRKIEARQMPPLDEERPSDADYDALSHFLVTRLDVAATKQPYAGHVDSFRRLTRTEYQNAIRDLLAVEIDAADLLPADEFSHGFDNITVGDLSPGLLTRYVQAARKIARLAVGSAVNRPDGTTYRIKADITQERHVPGLPLGTRGGGLFRHTFPRSGEYEVQVRLSRDRNDEVEGLRGTHQLEILLDRKRLAGLTVERPAGEQLANFDDSKLRARIQAPAGPHDLGVTFVRQGASLEETKRQPLNVHFNLHRHPRLTPAIYEVSITGPYVDGTHAAGLQPAADNNARRTEDQPPHGDTPSRRRVLIARPSEDCDANAAARQVLTALARRAYRRPVVAADLERLLEFFHEGNERDGFEAGIEAAIAAVLTSPHFLLKIEREPPDVQPGAAYAITEIELASRLSFFLWSSIPDGELLDLAAGGELRKPNVLAAQVKRMLADDKASNLATNFASQWLHLRNLDAIRPDGRLYPDFDENLRRSMRRETQLHVREMIAEDRSLLDLIHAVHTYLDERLAKHYGVPHIYGSRFRRVALPEGSKRGGLLRHGSILTVTSYATRTSPVIRGNWVLENLLGTPAPPPPEDVPSLDEQQVVAEHLTVRERLSQHREDPSCASCHNLMDPVGFALENFDAVGRWRERDGGQPVDATGGLPGGNQFSGVAGLESAVLQRPELFVATTTEKLMTFALGRGMEPDDGPAIRAIAREAAKDNYRFSSIVLGIVRGTPFQMRTAQ